MTHEDMCTEEWLRELRAGVLDKPRGAIVKKLLRVQRELEEAKAWAGYSPDFSAELGGIDRMFDRTAGSTSSRVRVELARLRAPPQPNPDKDYLIPEPHWSQPEGAL